MPYTFSVYTGTLSHSPFCFLFSSLHCIFQTIPIWHVHLPHFFPNGWTVCSHHRLPVTPITVVDTQVAFSCCHPNKIENALSPPSGPVAHDLLCPPTPRPQCHVGEKWLEMVRDSLAGAREGLTNFLGACWGLNNSSPCQDAQPVALSSSLELAPHRSRDIAWLHASGGPTCSVPHLSGLSCLLGSGFTLI